MASGADSMAESGAAAIMGAGAAILAWKENKFDQAKIAASATADVSVAIKESNVGAAAVDNTIQGGKNVTVNMTNAGDGTPGTNADKITLGATTAAKGDVVVNVTGKAYDAADGAIGFGAIAVTGGKTVSVTQKASSDASKAAADTTADKSSFESSDLWFVFASAY